MHTSGSVEEREEHVTLHVAAGLLPVVLDELARVLVPRGVLFCSNPRAFHSYQEGWNAERYGCYWTIDGWTQQIARTGLV